MTNKTLEKATNDYIRAYEGLKKLSVLLDTHEHLTPKQTYDAQNSINKFIQDKQEAERIICEVLDGDISNADRREFLEKIYPYIRS